MHVAVRPYAVTEGGSSGPNRRSISGSTRLTRASKAADQRPINDVYGKVPRVRDGKGRDRQCRFHPSSKGYVIDMTALVLCRVDRVGGLVARPKLPPCPASPQRSRGDHCPSD